MELKVICYHYNTAMSNFVEEGQSWIMSPMGEVMPTQIMHHFCNTVVEPVASVSFLEFSDFFLKVTVPYLIQYGCNAQSEL